MSSPDWRHEAREVYELGLAALAGIDRTRLVGDADFLIEELQDALLDLKQAFIADDIRNGHRAIDEVWSLLDELQASEE